MKISDIAVKRPVTITMIVLMAIILGAIALNNIPVALLPDLDLPVAVVVTQYEGAGPESIESLVTEPIEEAVQGVSNVNSVVSFSNDGVSQVIVRFDWGTDLDFAIQDVREQADVIQQYLPDDAEDPYTIALDPTQLPILEYGFTSDNLELDQLRSTIENDFVPRLERQEGIASVDVEGGLEREIQIFLDPNKMQSLNLSPEQILESIYASNFDLPVGNIVTDDQNQFLLRTLGEFREIDDIKNVMVPADGRTYYLEDIARVEDTHKDIEQYIRVNGQESVGLSIQEEADANTVQAAENVKAELSALMNDYSDLNINKTEIMDQSNYISLAIQTVVNNAIVGGALAILVLYLFLLSISTTMIIAIVIPVSIMATFFLMYFADMSLNVIAMGGLALGIGMLVDNSIVVIESIYRHRIEGKPSARAAVDGTNEVAVAIIASTITTLMVFLPVVFIEGVAGEIFKDLSFTVAFSLIISLIVSISFIPMLASKFLEKVNIKNLQKKQENNISTKVINKISNIYEGFLRKAIRKRAFVLIIILMVLASSILLYRNIGSEFMPDIDEGQVNVSIEMPEGTPYGPTLEFVRYFETELDQFEDIENYKSMVGSAGLGDTANININLVELSERKNSTSELVDELRAMTADINDIDVEVSELSSLTGSSDEIGNAPIEINLLGDDQEQLEKTAHELKYMIEEIPGTIDVSTGIRRTRPELQIDVDHKKAGMYGLTPAHVSGFLDIAVDGQVISRYNAEDNPIDIRARFDDEITDIHALNQTPLYSPAGMTIPVSEVAHVYEGEAPGRISRRNQTRSVAVYSDLDGADMGAVIDEVDEILNSDFLPMGMDYEYGSETDLMQEAFRDLTLALILSIVLVFMVLASQFESYIQPFILILSIPFGFVGVIWALFISGLTLNVISYIGIIMLGGIVVNNTIILLDYINQMQKEYDSPIEAVVQASKVRLRPILMTTATTVLAMLPMAISRGEGAEVQAPIATTVIGGLLISTITTLLLIPIIYTLYNDYILKNKEEGSN